MPFEDLNRSKSSAAQDEVARQILQEEAQRSFDDKPRLNFTLRQSPEAMPHVYGPVKDQDLNRDFDTAYRAKQLPEPGTRSVREVRDQFIDNIIPGFGRIESKDESWRFDYLDPSNCDSKAQIGLCFKIKR